MQVLVLVLFSALSIQPFSLFVEPLLKFFSFVEFILGLRVTFRSSIGVKFVGLSWNS